MRPGFVPRVGTIPWRKERVPTPIFLGFPCGSAAKESACSAGDLGLIPGLGRERLPTPVFWPGEFRGLYSPWCRKELDTTKQLSLTSLTLVLWFLLLWITLTNTILYIHTIKILFAAAAKLLQSCPTLCDLIDRSPPGSPIPGILQARTLEWVAISFSNA